MIKKPIKTPPIPGSFANFAGVNKSDLQTIIDFLFVQPTEKGKAKSGILIKRIILPPAVALSLGKILVKSNKDEKRKK